MSDKTISSFADLGLAPAILTAVEAVGYETPSPIQASSIPALLAGRDVVGQAQTGTGKTAAFALPLLSRLDLKARKPQILVLTPTRELALQVAEAMKTYASRLGGFHVLPVYGGQNIGTQLRQLRRKVHVIVGTPGRIQDHLRRKTLDLSDLAAVVLDEADEMLRMGFVDDVEEILVHTPAEKQVALFSATMPAAIRRIAAKHLRDPVELEVEAKTATVETVEQKYWRVGRIHKLDALTRILEAEEFDAMLVFVRTKTATVELAEKLEARGFACGPLNGDMNQALRERTIARLKKGRLDIVVATDVAARGLDVDRISHVVNYDIPYDVEAYVHRIGRTGRAGRAGQAILFVSPRERRMLFAIERATRQQIAPMELPTVGDVAQRRVARFKARVAEVLASEDLSFFEQVVDELQEENSVGSRHLGAALACLAQKDRPLRPRFAKERGSTIPRPTEGKGRAENRGRPPAPPPRAGMDRYRVALGRENGVAPGNLVGALINEGGFESRDIGHIEIYGTSSTVDLPQGLPRGLLKHLRQVWVCGKRLAITREGPKNASESPAKTAAASKPSAGNQGPRKRRLAAKTGKKRRKRGKKAKFSRRGSAPS